MSSKELEQTVADMTAKGRGVLAADESTGTIGKRFAQIDVENVEPNRQAYRELLFTTPGFEQHVSGVILFEETLGQNASDGTPFAKLLASKGVVPGIKVDKGVVPLFQSPNEKTTQGLDGLAERLDTYKAQGARFAKWRAVITIGDGIPTAGCIEANAHGLARYASICQSKGIVPIVEPEVLMDADNTLERCFEVTAETLHQTFAQLHRQGVVLEHMLLKPNMVIAGKQCKQQATPQQVADATLTCLRRHVPAAVPGIVFLSGGQTEEQATLHLDLMNKAGSLPWNLSFSYGRALQQAALKAWSGKAANVDAGRAAFAHRAKMNGLATLGTYDVKLERAAVNA
jgi:fructose-bisphosphate aldolase class I